MGAMDYISSRDICYLASDTLGLMDRRPAEHGLRIAYMLMKLLEGKGGYDEYEAAEFVFLAMIHDIGAYRTEELSEGLLYDTQETGNAHCVYGALFLRGLSPFGDRADIIRYHHLPYSRLSRIEYKYDRIAMYLSLLEDVDRLYRRDGAGLDCGLFEKEMGGRYFPEAVALLLESVRKGGMLTKLASGGYQEELRDFMDNVLFTNEEKENYIRFIMHCFSLKRRMRAAEAIQSYCIVGEIAESMDLTIRSRKILEYAAMFHDIGMLMIDQSILKATRELTEGEIRMIRGHVAVGADLMKTYFREQEIADLVATHHELLDGSGYPSGLGEEQLLSQQSILQVADCLTAMINGKKFRQAPGKEEIIAVLKKHVDRKRLSKRAVQGVIDRYDMIEKRILAEMRTFLETHVRISNRYKLLAEKAAGEKL